MISLEGNPRTEINMEGIVCRRVPVFAAFRESGRQLAAPGELYAVSAFTHGLGYSDIDAPGKTMDVFDAATTGGLPPSRAFRPVRSAGRDDLGQRSRARCQGRWLH